MSKVFSDRKGGARKVLDTILLFVLTSKHAVCDVLQWGIIFGRYYSWQPDHISTEVGYV